MKATFGAGCFWGVQAAFKKIDGVAKTTVGYEGGLTDNPSYEDVCKGDTNHAEVVEVEYDESTVSYDQLLDAFWNMHDPTQVNRQGPDTGTQYRSVIFYHSEEQKQHAEASKKKQEENLGKPIATHIEPAVTFNRAEEYHQDYFDK